MRHHRARFMPRGRELVVRRVVMDGETVWEWVRRWREATESERLSLACLSERSSRPHSSPARVAAEEEQRICELRQRTGWSPRRLAVEVDRPHSTVHRVLSRADCSRQPQSDRLPVIRYEWPCPGQLLHMDVKRLGKFTEPGHAITGDRTHRSRHAG